VTRPPRPSRPEAAARGARTAALLFGLLFAFACGAEAPDFPHPQSLEEAKSDAAARGVPILIDFYTPG
jgi:sorbitol-specific phosphotransferase system component IIBC